MIFFDLDGTLLDHEKAERNGAAAFQSFHVDVFPESAADFYGRWHAISEKHMNRFLNGEITEQDQRRDRMRELFADEGMTDEAADEKFDYYLQQYQENWCLFPDVMDCLERLRELPLGIITNGGPTQQRKKLSDVGIASFFSLIVISAPHGQ
jgi:putative hydrolase of the HAD superfamily